ncbi:hypothetical protein RYX36_025986 [Vicia faba]
MAVRRWKRFESRGAGCEEERRGLAAMGVTGCMRSSPRNGEDHHHTMSRPFIMIVDLKEGNNVWKIVIRVVDLWSVKERNGQQHFEGGIQDRKGDKIHVVTRNRDFDM